MTVVGRQASGVARRRQAGVAAVLMTGGLVGQGMTAQTAGARWCVGACATWACATCCRCTAAKSPWQPVARGTETAFWLSLTAEGKRPPWLGPARSL